MSQFADETSWPFAVDLACSFVFKQSERYSNSLIETKNNPNTRIDQNVFKSISNLTKIDL